jgi:hypothetical protein
LPALPLLCNLKDFTVKFGVLITYVWIQIRTRAGTRGGCASTWATEQRARGCSGRRTRRRASHMRQASPEAHDRFFQRFACIRSYRFRRGIDAAPDLQKAFWAGIRAIRHSGEQLEHVFLRLKRDICMDQGISNSEWESMQPRICKKPSRQEFGPLGT